jgi:hypothetical protein
MAARSAPPWTRTALAGATAGAMAVDLIVGTGEGESEHIALFAIAVGALAALAVLEFRQPLLDRRIAIGFSAAVLVVAVLCPPRHSGDLWSYAMYGRIVAVHNGDAYTELPSDFADDPLYPKVDEMWRDKPSLYGPAATVHSAIVARLTGTWWTGTRLAYQACAALATAGILWLVDRRTRSAMAVALIGLNPAVMLFTVSPGHIDALVGLGIAAAVVLFEGRRPTAAGAAIAAAALFKIAAGLTALPILLWSWRHRRTRDGVVTSAVTAAGIFAGYALVGRSAAWDDLVEASRGSNWSSMWRWVIYHGAALGDRTDYAVQLASRITLVVGALVLLAVVSRLRDRTPELAVVAAFAVYLFVAPHTLVWYAVWALPLAAFRWRSAPSAILFAWTGTLVAVSALPHPDGLAPTWFYALSLAAAAAVIASGFVARARRSRARIDPAPAAQRYSPV